jgi:mRNA interferase HigB
LFDVRIFNRSTLVAFWSEHPDSEHPLRLWFSVVERASWRGPSDIKAHFASASFVAGDRVIFNIRGNKYRLIAHVKYGPMYLVYMRFIGTHEDYDRVDATTV